MPRELAMSRRNLGPQTEQCNLPDKDRIEFMLITADEAYSDWAMELSIEFAKGHLLTMPYWLEMVFNRLWKD